MKEYRVFYKVTEYAYVDLDAENEESAKILAEEMNNNGTLCAKMDGDAEWVFDNAIPLESIK